jgi:hypothetical protein
MLFDPIHNFIDRILVDEFVYRGGKHGGKNYKLVASSVQQSVERKQLRNASTIAADFAPVIAKSR